jgi:hypothetical protein
MLNAKVYEKTHKPHSDIPTAPLHHLVSVLSLQPSAFFIIISSYQDALIFNLLCRRLFVSLRPVNLSQAHAGPN